MLPLQQAYEVRGSILEFIRTTYRFKDADLQKAFFEFIEDPQHGLLKGPYVSLKAPFVSASSGYSIPLEIAPTFEPYLHQIEAFDRLSARNGNTPQNTLITTGTGSGKTECFQFPILDYCYQHIGEKGIKVIILYPMNALATDQAKRLAEAIWNDERLKGKVTAGLFIGKGTDKKDFSQVMTEDGIIEDARQIVANPPDILLTNFKMLDYGIMKSENASLWVHNVANPGLLRYLVLDELHTYDGAQGTDVANLIRRLKLRIGIDHGSICGIGTSATIGSGEESKQLLCEYASDIFGEQFLPENVIEEHRVGADELFPGRADNYLPSQRALDRLAMKIDESHDAYIRRQIDLWSAYPAEGEEPDVAITDTLKTYKIIRDLFSICEESGIILVDDIINKLSVRNSEYASLEDKYKKEIIESLLSLIAEAKEKDHQSGRKRPFLPLQVQLWIRELSGIRRYVSEVPKFSWRSDVQTSDETEAALPMYYCRECGASGWITTKSDREPKFNRDGSAAAQAFMDRKTEVWLLNTVSDSHLPDEKFEKPIYRIKKKTLEIVDHLDPDESQMKVFACRRMEQSQRGHNRSSHYCPECSTNFDDLSIVGARTATLASLSVSQVLSSNLDNASDRERKTLTFTNSVQDAAHLSGFFTSREYRFTMRASIQKVIEMMEAEGAEVTLQSVYECFTTYWKEKTGSIKSYLYRFFPNDYIGEINLDRNFLNSDGTYRQRFLDDFDLRMFWEIISEFGLMTSFGRSLERTGSSASYFKKEDFDATYEKIDPWLEEYMPGTTKEQFEHFLIGFLERSLIHGAIAHPFLDRFRESLRLYDLNWSYNKTHFLNRRFGRRETLPQPLIIYPSERNIGDNAYTNQTSWYYSYFVRCFDRALASPLISNDFYKKGAETLTETGIFDKVDGSDGPNYCINPAKVHLSTHVKVHRCDHCQSALFTSEEDTLSPGTPCIVRNCTGYYNNPEEQKTDYYRRIYRRERTPRIYSHEHTGLLDRKEREEVEKDFKERPNTDSLNSLVATSTLEMGIDIGDLNSELNVGIPPLPSNYLQRVGRAGRKSSGALILDFVKSDPHDLYFFEDPLSMMAGKVNTPGCFLNAKDILRRHFYAYCIDSWTAEDPTKNIIPAVIRIIKPDTDFLSSPDFFINRISAFIEENLDSLTSNFSRHYSEDTYRNVLVPLFEDFANHSFENHVEQVFDRLHQKYLSLSSRIRAILDDIAERHLPHTDDEYKELMQQKEMLRRQRNAIKRQQVLEFMTDEGLLPNYAFPETGVKLTASVLGSVPKGEEEGTQAEIKEYEVVRSASAGLKDLAPGNHFYFDGMKLTVNGINTSDWESSYGLVRRRFCTKCDCIVTETETHHGACPKCGDLSFGSTSNVHTFVDMREVKVNARQKDITLDDKTDERERVNYRSTFHFTFNPGSSAVSYGMKDIPFGIEYVKSVDILQTNLGENSIDNALDIEINRVKVPRHGFVTCRYCGKSIANPELIRSRSEDEQLKEFHYPYCKHKNKLYDDRADEVFEHVFLSREFHTEAIKILLPVQAIDSEATTAMFKAGLSLGLRQYFRGNPQHIAMREYQEFNSAAGKFDSYVILYDTIPGGTGYLAKLFNTQEFSKVLRLAWEQLDSCACQHEGKDGCYHCVLSYENRYTQGQLSRSKAAELFKRIVDKSDNWEEISGSIGTVTRGGGIEESELETKFITSLREICERKEGWSFAVKHSPSVYYQIEVTGKEGEKRTYTVTAQVTLGPARGVEFTTRPDFFFECVKREKDGVELDKGQVPQIALYLDGYAYHGSTQNGHVRFYDDFKKREAIHRSGKIISWTMTWQDLDNKHISNESESMEDSLMIPAAERNRTYWNRQDNIWKNCINDYDRFLKVLAEIDESRFHLPTVVYALAWMQNGIYEDADGYLSFAHPAQPGSAGCIGPYIGCKAPKDSAWCETRIAVTQTTDANGRNTQKINYAIRTTDVGTDLDKETWNHFWRLYNILNLSKEDMYVPAANTAVDLDAILENFDESIHDMVRLLVGHGIEFDTDGGFTLVGEDGYSIEGDAQLGVESLNVVIDPLDEASETAFTQRGYTVVKPGEIEKLKTIIGE